MKKNLSLIVFLCFLFFSSFSSNETQENKNYKSSEVVPINISHFTKGNPKDSLSLRWQLLVNNACKEILQDWWRNSQCYGNEGKYIDFGYLENNEKKGEFGQETKGGIRAPAEHAYVLAAAVFTKIYDSTITKVPEKTAIARAVTIIKSIAKDHKVNGGINHPWGDQWQSAQWAAKCAMAGWMLWDYLKPVDKENVRRMIEHEADRFLGATPPAANANYKIDTKAEEDAWDATGIQAACTMMPNHPNYKKWYDKSIEYMMTAFAAPEDLKKNNIVDGRPAHQWISGFNIDSIGALGNHGAYPHPDYMAAVTWHGIEGSIYLSLAGLQVPKANKFNSRLIYSNYVNYKWNGRNTIYQPDGSIYWPIKIEADRRFDFLTYGLVDAGAVILKFDGLAKIKANYWEEKHTEKSIEMKLTDIAAANAYLLHWLKYQGVHFFN
jgi:hypothetical protein